MDDDELASFFAAKKENEELKEKLKMLENRILDKEKHIKRLISASTYLKDRYSKMLSFIKLLDKYPMFWGGPYKRSIKQFLGR